MMMMTARGVRVFKCELGGSCVTVNAMIIGEERPPHQEEANLQSKRGGPV